jgi:hypothetical protein
MHNRHYSRYSWQSLSCFALIFTLGGCTGLKDSQHESTGRQAATCDCSDSTHEDGTSKKPPTVSEQRKILNEGYSLLHQDATKLNLSQLILYVKSESDAFKSVITDVASFAGKVEKDLERIEKDYPAVDINLDPLPVMEKRKRWDIGKDKVIDFAPGIGRGGRDYERTVLISLLNGINHERHLCKVMAKEEPEASLKKVLNDTERGYDAFYERIDTLLNKEYFKN